MQLHLIFNKGLGDRHSLTSIRGRNIFFSDDKWDRLIKIERIVGPHLPFAVWKTSILLFYNPLLKISAKYADWKELRGNKGRSSPVLVPPPSLRLRVGGGRSERSTETFLKFGKIIADDIEDILQSQLKRNLSSFHDILDFGCGCGRALIWLRNLTSKPK